MNRRSRLALGASTAVLVASFVALGVSLLVPWTLVEPDGSTSVGGPGALLGYGSLLVVLTLGAALLGVYLVVVLARRDWSWRRRSIWAVLLWIVAPVAMPTYFLRHVQRRG